MPGHHHLSPGARMMPGCHPCHDHTNTFINFLGCFLMSEHVSVSRNASCIPLVLGTPSQKKGNEGQTENIRIIEISGKIFCVRTCHVPCVSRSGDDRHCHECHEILSSKNKRYCGCGHFLGNTQQVFGDHQVELERRPLCLSVPSNYQIRQFRAGAESK